MKRPPLETLLDNHEVMSSGTARDMCQVIEYAYHLELELLRVLALAERAERLLESQGTMHDRLLTVSLRVLAEGARYQVVAERALTGAT